MTTWVTVAQASGILGMSERSVRRHVAKGKLESRMDGSRRVVKVEVEDGNVGMVGMTIQDKDSLIQWFRIELEERNKQIGHLQEELKQGRERSDEIIMKLAGELEAQRSVLENRQMPRKRNASLWQRLRREYPKDE